MAVAFRALAIGLGLAILSGCGGQNGGTLPQGLSAQSKVHKASGSYGDLLYAAGPGVSFYTYPGGQLVGTITGGATDLCSDAQGDVYVPGTGSNDIAEYPHGGTKYIKLLKSPNLSFLSCAVDSETGDLAATNANAGARGIAVFKNATGTPIQYSYYTSNLQSCGYDGSGNLFADTIQRDQDPTLLVELPAGGSALQTLKVPARIQRAGRVQFDGTYMTITDELAKVIYRLSINGSAVTVVGKTNLGGPGHAILASWIYNGTFIAPLKVRKHKKHDNGHPPWPFASLVGYWNYPAGDGPTETIKMPYKAGAVTISVAPSR